MNTLILVVVLGLAAYRATRFLTDDSLTHELRVRIYQFGWAVEPGDDEPTPRSTVRSYVATLLTCAQCLGVWVAVAFYALWDHAPDARFVLVVLAAAGVQSLFGWYARSET